MELDTRTDFEELIMPHMGELRAYCSRLAPTRWDAEDLCQEVLLRLFRSYRRGGSVEHARPLLYTIARNLWIDAGRRKRLRTVAIGEAYELPLAELSYASARGIAEWVAEHLSAREACMLVLAAVHRYSYQEIAEEMNCATAAVKMVLHRAKAALRATGGAAADGPSAGRGKRTAASPRLKRSEIDAWTHALLRNEPVVHAVSG